MNQFRQLASQLSLQQKILIVIAACVVAGGILLGVRWNRERDLRPLFTSLAPEDAAAVVEHLRTAQVDYKVADSGTVMAPSARVAELRLDLAAAGLPRSGRAGFELFDKQNFGSTEFDDQIRLRRAIEGELERSVMTLTGVEAARVHVTFAKDSVFSDLRQPAKASVLVRLRPGTQLSQQNIAAIEHLTASAVEGLEPQAVSVVDMNGNLLGKPRSPLDSEAGASSAMLDYRQSMEHDLLVKLRSTLDPLLGPEKYRAGVTVECDFTSGDQSEETFDPDHSVMLTSQKTEEANGSTASGGVPGTASNLPRPVPPTNGGRGSVSRKTESVTYQTSRIVKHVRMPQGAVKRVSVAILVDQGVHWEGAGRSARRVLDPPSADTLKVVKDVVSGVIGFQQNRGDQVLVETLPFDATLTLPAPEQAARPAPGDNSQPPAGLGGPLFRLRSVSPLWLVSGGCLLIAALVGLGVMVRMRLKRRTRKLESAVTGPPSLAGGTATPAQLGARGEFEARAMAQLAENRQNQDQTEIDALQPLKMVPTTRKSEVYKKFIVEETKKDPGKMAQLMRSWLSGEAV